MAEFFCDIEILRNEGEFEARVEGITPNVMSLKSDNLEEANELILSAGDNFHVYRGLRHQMIALEDSELFEFSTQHFDSDSYRVVKGD